MRKLILLAIGLTTALSAFSAGARAQSNTTGTGVSPVVIRAGYLTGPSRVFKAAYDNKRFEGKNYKLELTEFATGQDQFAAFAAGNLDIFFIDYASGISALKRGLKLVYFSPWTIQVPRAYFLSRGDKAIAKTDLKGKKVGIGPGQFYHVHTQKWIESLGFTASTEPGKADVLIVKIAEAALPSALANGDVDIVHTWDRASAYQWINDFKFKFVESAEDGARASNFLGASARAPSGGWFVHPDFLKKHSDVLREFDQDSRAAKNWFVKLPPQEQRTIWEKGGGKSVASLAKGLDQATFDSLFTLRMSAVSADEKFEIAVLSEWLDSVAAITGGVPSSKEIDVRTTVAPHLLK